MRSKWVIVLLVGVLGAAVYGGIALATPPQGVSNPLLVIGNFAGGIDAKTKRTSSPRAGRSVGTAIPDRAS